MPIAKRLSDNRIFASYQAVTDKPQLIQFYDSGELEDVKYKDGIYTAIVKLNNKGFYQARIISELKTDTGTITREKPISFLIK